ncbi:MAG: shikimate kinase [Oscillospiraceae bacterium]|nr:shikimate kinase [Oscillospiraceae bacterium]
MERFGLIGRKLGHSFSPDIHSMVGGYEYKLYPLEPEELALFLRDTELDGINVTIPYKKDVIPMCRELSPRAKTIGSVNTMLRMTDGSWFGDNTDYYGFVYLLGRDAETLKDKKALVLGSGGASQTVCAVFRELGVSHTVISRTGENNYGNLSLHSDAEIIVNTTPVGMYPNNGESPVNLGRFPRCRLVIDLIYNPTKTALLLQAEELGITARNGLAMLAAQGVKAGELFLGKKSNENLTEEIIECIRRKTESIVLIGMPGCGKTTVAQYLSEITGRKAVDTDMLIYEQTGIRIPEIFSRYGEKHFRELETEALREVSKESGLIIAAGGGVVTVPENRALIRQNSICVFLDSDPSRLDVTDRPISQTKGIKKLLEERMPLYRSWSDRIYKNENSHETAIKIKEDMKL